MRSLWALEHRVALQNLLNRTGHTFLLWVKCSQLFWMSQIPSSSSPDSVEDELELSAVRHRPEGLEKLEALTRFNRKELQILYRGFKNVSGPVSPRIQSHWKNVHWLFCISAKVLLHPVEFVSPFSILSYLFIFSYYGQVCRCLVYSCFSFLNMT